jgi:hypothetical protein
MKNITIIIAILILSLSINSCKKETTTPSSGSGGGTPPTTTTTSTSNGFPFSSVNTISGVFKADYVFQTVNNFGDYEADAALYNSPLPFGMCYMYSQVSTLSNDVGSLFLNNSRLSKQTSGGSSTILYTDTTGGNYSSGVTWSLNPTGSFPSFTTTVTRSFPSCTSNTFIPTTVSLSAGITINIPGGGFTNADSVSVFIIGQPSTIFNKSFAGSVSSLQITSSELSGFSASNPNGVIYVYAKNFSNQFIGIRALVYIMQKTWITPITFNP